MLVFVEGDSRADPVFGQTKKNRVADEKKSCFITEFLQHPVAKPADFVSAFVFGPAHKIECVLRKQFVRIQWGEGAGLEPGVTQLSWNQRNTQAAFSRARYGNHGVEP